MNKRQIAMVMVGVAALAAAAVGCTSSASPAQPTVPVTAPAQPIPSAPAANAQSTRIPNTAYFARYAYPLANVSESCLEVITRSFSSANRIGITPAFTFVGDQRVLLGFYVIPDVRGAAYHYGLEEKVAGLGYLCLKPPI